MLISNPKIGDDDVITELNSIEDYSKFIRELPQSTFPVGNMLNLYSKRNLFPGLNSPEPYIFHANFVVGINEKLKLLQVLSKSRLNKKVRIPSNLINSIELKLREIKFRIIMGFLKQIIVKQNNSKQKISLKINNKKYFHKIKILIV